LKINILKNTADHLEFDMIGVDASIANAIRRILIAEVMCHFVLSLSVYVIVLLCGNVNTYCMSDFHDIINFSPKLAVFWMPGKIMFIPG